MARGQFGRLPDSQVALDFKASAEFSNLAPERSAKHRIKGLLDPDIKAGIKAPQQLMAGLFTPDRHEWCKRLTSMLMH